MRRPGRNFGAPGRGADYGDARAPQPQAGAKEDRRLAHIHSPDHSETCGGHGPDKRAQIIEGARTVFLERGFDGASMGDIARAAGVSKGTLYVYFKNKEDLFGAVVTAVCGETAEGLFVLDHAETDVAAALTRLGQSFIEAMVEPGHIAIVRTVIAISGRFPEIGRRFFEAGPQAGTRRLAAYLEAKVAEGRLDIADPEEAATQFLALCKEAVTQPILMGCFEGPGTALTRRTVAGAVHVFMRAYGRPAR